MRENSTKQNITLSPASNKITETPYHLYPKHPHSVSHKTVFSLTPAEKTPVLFLKTEKKGKEIRLPLSFPPSQFAGR